MKTRIKTHQMPGDVSKQTKQAMLEGRHPSPKRSKTFKTMVHDRERAVLKERTQAELKKPCGHADHPEDGNFGIVPKGRGPRIENGAMVEANRNKPGYFVGKFVKLAFPTGLMPGDIEYMWVEVKALHGDAKHELRGTLNNHPLRCTFFVFGEVLAFGTDEILDVMVGKAN